MEQERFLSRREFTKVLGLGAAGLSALSRADAVENEPFAIVHGPVAQSPGAGEVNITWHTNRSAVARVLYGYDGALTRTAFTSRDGLVPNDSTCHAVRLTGLTPGRPVQYKLVAQEFKRYVTPYVVRFGDTVESDVFACAPLDPHKESFSFLMWNDIHDQSGMLKEMFDDADWDGVDFVVLNGDIINDPVSEQQIFNAFYDVCAERFGARLPMVFVRGNHETRGGLARRLAEYTPGRDGRPYYSFDHGAAHVAALDSGEDKPDGNTEYAGLVDFAPFREAQTGWLQADLESDASRRARWRIMLSHIPIPLAPDNCFGAQEVGRLWRPLANAAGAHLWLSGHNHRFFAATLPGDTFHTVINPPDATVRVDASPETLAVTVVQKGGKILHQQTITA